MNSYKKIITKIYQSPCGTLILGSMDDTLCLCDWLGREDRNRIDRRLQRLLKAGFEEGDSHVTREAAARLDEYFKGERQAFDIPLSMVGSEFQKKVWSRLLEIPFGTTISYRELAEEIGRPTAVRAVANAVGANAISILIPCHRVVGSRGALTGYAGGLSAKKYLLSLES